MIASFGVNLGSLFVVYRGIMNKFEQNIYDKLKDLVESLGVELCEVEFKKMGGNDNLTVFIYMEDGVTLNDCERVHKFIDPILDELDPTNNAPYTLNVSSLGLDRPFKTDRDFERYLGLPVELKFYKATNGKKQINGILADFDEQVIKLDINDEIFEFDKKVVAVARPYVEF